MAVSAEQILTHAVRSIAGPSAEPRPGQRQLCLDTDHAMVSRVHHAGIGPTGVGKSLGYLSAACAAALRGERTVISTEALSLQNQLIGKDAPIVLAAVEELTGVHLSVVRLMGRGNYACTATAEHILARYSAHRPSSLYGVPCTGEDLREICAWAESITGAYDSTRHEYPGALNEDQFALISSASPARICTSSHEHPCGYQWARAEAERANIIITNHAVLATQAVTGRELAVTDNIDHLVIDEAHTLPGIVRDHATGTISAASLTRLASTLSPRTRETAGLKTTLTHLARQIDAALTPRIGHRQSEQSLAGQPCPLSHLVDDMSALVAALDHVCLLPAGENALHRLATTAEQLTTIVGLITLMSGPQGRRIAQWISRDTTGLTLHLIPVDTAGMLASRLWRKPAADPGREPTPRSVTAVSATLPPGFTIDAGLKARPVEYPSPFTDAHQLSRLFVPAPTEADIAQLCRATDSTPAKPVFDTERHVTWAMPRIRALLEENGGRALIVTATTGAGRSIASALRDQTPHLRVHSQWDDRPVAQTIAEWKLDEQSVMVGTRSLMTGVDAPGETCSLVIVDRVPRSAVNPVDEARVDLLAERLGSSWLARTRVYAGDAALLLEQAAGRMIRRADDHGLLAVLDPRLIDGHQLSYAPQTVGVYRQALRRFTSVDVTLDGALEYLRTRRIHVDSEGTSVAGESQEGSTFRKSAA